ncbi:MAG: response regulator [Elusimicrobiota bacterium]
MGKTPTSTKPLILVVDDRPELGQLLKIYLEDADYEVSLAFDGPEALASARNRPPDLAVCDVGLPSMQGWELCEKLKSLALPRILPVIMLTAKTTEFDEVRSFESCADEHFTKPANFQALVAAVTRHLSAIGRI